MKKTPKKTPVDIFSQIRIIGNYQVLAYKEATNDEIFVNFIYRLKDRSNVSMKMTFDEISDMDGSFKKFCSGKLDKVILAQIGNLENSFKTGPIDKDQEAVAE